MQAPVEVWLSAGTRLTTFCWFSGPIPSAPTLMLKARFWKITLLNSSGNETLRQFAFVALVPAKCPAGQMTVPGRFAVRLELFCTDTRPAGCGQLAVAAPLVQFLPWLLASGAPSVLNSTPEDAVVSLDMIVLFTMFTFSASCSEMPAPSQPATLSVMMLLVTFTAYQRVGRSGKVSTSVPLTFCRRR